MTSKQFLRNLAETLVLRQHASGRYHHTCSRPKDFVYGSRVVLFCCAEVPANLTYPTRWHNHEISVWRNNYLFGVWVRRFSYPFLLTSVVYLWCSYYLAIPNFSSGLVKSPLRLGHRWMITSTVLCGAPADIKSLLFTIAECRIIARQSMSFWVLELEIASDISVRFVVSTVELTSPDGVRLLCHWRPGAPFTNMD